MKKIGIFLFFLLSFCLISFPAAAQERLTQMDVRAVVGSDAVLTVTERIDFVAEGIGIRRGLIRSIPIGGRRHGRRVTGDFRLLSATLDGRPVPYELHRQGRTAEIHLGDDSFLKHGAHTYVLTYTLADQLAFHEDGDELYWNVTGNDWSFPIEKATFRLEPPKGASIFEFDGWTGRPGSGAKDRHGGEDGVFHTTRALAPGEGFTVSAVWTKGFVVEPPESPFRVFVGRRYRILFFLSALSIVAWYGGWWLAVGRDPKRGVVIPLFDPPASLGPALARCVRTLKFDSDGLLADLIDLAVRGYLSLKPVGRCLEVSRTAKSPDAELPPSGQALLAALFAGGGTRVALGDTSAIGDPRGGTGLVRRLLGVLPSFYGFGKRPVDPVSPRPPLRFRNMRVNLSGLVLFVPLLWLLSFMKGFGFENLLGVLPFLFIVFWFTTFASATVAGLRSKSPAGQPFAALFQGVRKLVCVIILIAACFMFTAFLPLARPFFGALAGMDPVALTLLVATVLTAVVFAFLMPARTAEGRRLLDQVEGLELYLKTAEKHRLEALYPAVRGRLPEPSPELFERLLPWAFALGVAHTWIDAFAPLLAAREYNPGWCPSSGPFNAARFHSSMDSFGSSVRSSSSGGGGSGGGGSSGRGGRGSSGGGGGGGGGRGR